MKPAHSTHIINRSQLGTLIFTLWIALIVPAAAFGVAYSKSGSTVVRVSGETIENNNRTPGSGDYLALEHHAYLDNDLAARAQAEAALNQIHNAWAAKLNVPVAQWSAVALAPQNPNIILVASHSSLYLSRNGGTQWERLGQVLPGTFNSLAVSPANENTLYAGIDGLGMYFSQDAGRTWTLVDTGIKVAPEARLGITAIAIDPQNPQRLVVSAGLWMGTNHSQFQPLGLLKTNDGGKAWSQIPTLMVRPYNRLILDQNVLHVWQGVQHESYSVN